MMLFDLGGDRPAAAPAGSVLADDPRTDVEHELKLEQAEIASEPTTDLAALADDLRTRRAELIASAAARGVTVAALGTSPIPSRPTPTPDERYRRMHERYGLVADDQLTCGAHVHVGVASRAEGVAAIDASRAWLPVLVAMTANSPFWYGYDSGYASYRRISWGRWPTAGPTDRFGDEAGYDGRVRELIASGAALDDGMIYFDVRLSAKYPTVEFRVADVGQEVADAVLLAALCRAAVDTPPSLDAPTAMLRAAAWRAARFGLSEQLYDVVDGRLRAAADVVDHLLDAFTPALRRTGDEEYVHGSVDRLFHRGTGADLQRRDLEGGRPIDVIEAAARRTAG